MLEEWGAVAGDANADAIIHDRRVGKRYLNMEAIGNFALLAGCAIWYALTGSAAALAIEIIAAAWFIGSHVRRDLYQTHTMLLIAERRVQLLEQRVQELSMS